MGLRTSGQNCSNAQEKSHVPGEHVQAYEMALKTSIY